MPILGFSLGLHFVLAFACAVHAVRREQPRMWLLVLCAVPLVGSVAYLFAVYLPNSRLQRNALQAVAAAAKALDPQRDLRAAQAAFQESATPQNQMRLAAELLAVGDAPASVQVYEACLQGASGNDPELRFGAGRAYVECQRYAEALRYLEPLRRDRPDFHSQEVALLVARALAGTARNAEARAAFATAEERFGTSEAKAEYAIWAYAIGDRVTSTRLQGELDKLPSRWNGLGRELDASLARRLQTARELGRRA